jgi:hypothetical protein
MTLRLKLPGHEPQRRIFGKRQPGHGPTLPPIVSAVRSQQLGRYEHRELEDERR